MPKIKNIIIFTAIAAVFVLIYIFFIRPSPEEENLVLSPGAVMLPDMGGVTTGGNAQVTAPLIAKDFLSLLLNVKNIKLDDIFGFSLYFGDFKEIFFNRNFHKNIKIMYTLPEIKNPSAYQLNKLIDENLLITANFYENVEKYDKNCGIIYEF